jgi:hypothetical protein
MALDSLPSPSVLGERTGGRRSVGDLHPGHLTPADHRPGPAIAPDRAGPAAGGAIAGDRRPRRARRGAAVSGPGGGPSDRTGRRGSPRRAQPPPGPYEDPRSRPAGGGGSGPGRSQARLSRGHVGRPPGRIRDGGSPRRAHLTQTLLRILGHGRRAGGDPVQACRYFSAGVPLHACGSPADGPLWGSSRRILAAPGGPPAVVFASFSRGKTTATPPGGVCAYGYARGGPVRHRTTTVPTPACMLDARRRTPGGLGLWVRTLMHAVMGKDPVCTTRPRHPDGELPLSCMHVGRPPPDTPGGMTPGSAGRGRFLTRLSSFVDRRVKNVLGWMVHPDDVAEALFQ